MPHIAIDFAALSFHIKLFCILLEDTSVPHIVDVHVAANVTDTAHIAVHIAELSARNHVPVSVLHVLHHLAVVLFFCNKKLFSQHMQSMASLLQSQHTM